MTLRLESNQEDFVDDYRVTRDARAAAARAGMAVIERGWPLGFYVYGLIGGQGEVFYVGKGVRGRWMHHYREASGSSGNHGKRRAARSAGARECVILAGGLSEDEALEIERAFIRALTDGLTNISRGTRTEEQRSKDAAAELLATAIPFDRWIAAAERPPVHVAMYHRIVEELRKIAEHGQKARAVFRKVGVGQWERVAP